ncbi:MAG: hypothetical protein HQK53_18850 [Oligoflexia bacterium]|nr:hypothetical protein [Oligoflexia bacterium]
MKIAKVLLLSHLFLVITIQGVSAMQMMGNVSLKDQTLESLKVLGVAKLSNVIIKEDLLVTGPLDLKKGSKVEGELKVLGPADLDSVTIGSANIVGPFSAEDIEVMKSAKIVGPVDCEKCKFHSS